MNCVPEVDWDELSVIPKPSKLKRIEGKFELNNKSKVIIDSDTDEILGAHIVGEDATELIHELLLARSAELLPEDIADMIHAHPTLSETVMECMRAVLDRAIHA